MEDDSHDHRHALNQSRSDQHSPVSGSRWRTTRLDDDQITPAAEDEKFITRTEGRDIYPYFRYDSPLGILPIHSYSRYL